MTTSEAASEIFDLRKKADLELQAGSTEEFNRIQIQISQLQQKYGVVTGKEREKTMAEQLEKTSDEIQGLCDEITSSMESAYADLLAAREAEIADATAHLEAEAATLRREQADITEAAGNLESLLPAQQREAQRQADAALLAGRLEEAEAKRQEYETARRAPEAMNARQREIAQRLETIANEKKIIVKLIFETWISDLQKIIRASERGFFLGLLDKAHDELYTFQEQHGLPGSGLLTAALSTGLTAPEHSPEWKSGQNWYGGRQVGR
jgi:hypothetical protein